MTELLASPVLAAAGSAIGAAVIALWLAAAWWAYQDAARRTESTLAALLAAGWIVLSTPLFLPMALAIYRVARPQVSQSDQRAQELAHSLSASFSSAPVCTGCGAAVEPSWVRCPSCAAWLGAPCAACGEWSDPSFEICPWCAADRIEGPGAATPTFDEPAAPAVPALRRRGAPGGAVAWPPFGPGRSGEHRPPRRPLARV